MAAIRKTNASTLPIREAWMEAFESKWMTQIHHQMLMMRRDNLGEEGSYVEMTWWMRAGVPRGDNLEEISEASTFDVDKVFIVFPP